MAVTNNEFDAATAAWKEGDPSAASVDDVIKMVNAINQANEEVSSTSAANRNGVRRSSSVRTPRK